MCSMCVPRRKKHKNISHTCVPKYIITGKNLLFLRRNRNTHRNTLEHIILWNTHRKTLSWHTCVYIYNHREEFCVWPRTVRTVTRRFRSGQVTKRKKSNVPKQKLMWTVTRRLRNRQVTRERQGGKGGWKLSDVNQHQKSAVETRTKNE